MILKVMPAEKIQFTISYYGNNILQILYCQYDMDNARVLKRCFQSKRLSKTEFLKTKTPFYIMIYDNNNMILPILYCQCDIDNIIW